MFISIYTYPYICAQQRALAQCLLYDGKQVRRSFTELVAFWNAPSEVLKAFSS